MVGKIERVQFKDVDNTIFLIIFAGVTEKSMGVVITFVVVVIIVITVVIFTDNGEQLCKTGPCLFSLSISSGRKIDDRKKDVEKN